MNKCRECKFWSRGSYPSDNYGDCGQSGDVNDYTPDKVFDQHVWPMLLGCDYESCRAGVAVREDFGCILWEQK